MAYTRQPTTFAAGTVFTSAWGNWIDQKAQEVVSVKDFGATGDGTTDDTAAIQAAITYCISLNTVGGVVYLPPGNYRTTSTITTSNGSGQVGLRGAGRYATRIKPASDFTVIKLTTSYVDTGGFSIEWPVTAAASIPTSRIGVEFASASTQVAYSTVFDILCLYAYRSYVLNDWTGQPFGTAYLIKLENLSSFRAANWGFYLNSKTGSTTLIMEQCYARGDSSAGGQYGKGMYINNFNDVLLVQPAIDQCLNELISINNANVTSMISVALEANKVTSTTISAVDLASTQAADITGIKWISNTFDTGGTCRLVGMGATTNNLTLSGFAEQSNTTNGGTTKCKVWLNSEVSNAHILDRSVLQTEVIDNGWHSNFVFEGRRITSTNTTPTYGTWVRGDHIQAGQPVIGSPKGWYCTVAGSPGTWVSEGNL